MTHPTPGDIVDLDRPRPVRIAAFLGLLAQAVIVLLALLWSWSPQIVAATVGIVAVAQLGGWLFVERRVTPTSSPAVRRGGQLVPLVRGTPR